MQFCHGPGFQLRGDADGRWPLVLASPHSGREYPAHFRRQSVLPLSQLRRAEDGFVDALLDGVAGVPVLAARYARSYLDCNRAADEIDPAMFDGPTGLPHRASERVDAGLGVIPRVAAQGLGIYAAPLPAAEAAARIDALHRPWHEQLATLLATARAAHGFAVLVDCHSMPSPTGPRPPQIVLGDCHGRSAAPALLLLLEGYFSALGWRVARNNPYAGGFTTRQHGRPGLGIHAVQVEIDRALYMDQARLQPHHGFAGVARAMAGMARLLVQELPGLGLAPAVWRDAAE